MSRRTSQRFECQLYISAHGFMPILPQPAEPRRAIALAPIEYAELIDPGFRRLLAAFNTIPEAI